MTGLLLFGGQDIMILALCDTQIKGEHWYGERIKHCLSGTGS